MLSRQATHDDWVESVPKLVEAIATSSNRALVNISIEHTLSHFMAASERGGAYVVDETYLVVYDLYPLWYAPQDTIVEEKIILKIYPDGKGSMLNVFKFLMETKQYEAAEHLVIGDFLYPNQEKYGRVLMKLGMSKFNTLYTC